MMKVEKMAAMRVARKDVRMVEKMAALKVV